MSENAVENIVQRPEDQRKYQRVGYSVPIRYKDLRKIAEVPNGTTASNISEGGICFKSSKFISLACRLVVEISIPSSTKPIKAISKVAWIRRVPSTDQYELGNQFLDMAKEDKTHISNFISGFLNTNT